MLTPDSPKLGEVNWFDFTAERRDSSRTCAFQVQAVMITIVMHFMFMAALHLALSLSVLHLRQ